MMKVVRWLGMLAQDYKRCFMILMTGQCVFFVGIALFYMSAKHHDAQPLLSEIVAFFGLILIVIGVIIALIGYLSFTYGRWYHFFRRNPLKKQNTHPPEKNTLNTDSKNIKEPEIEQNENTVTDQAINAQGQTENRDR